MNRKIFTLLLAGALMMASGAVSQASGTSSASWAGTSDTDKGQVSAEKKTVVSLYDQGMAASKENNFSKALGLFQKALNEDPNNPDILNMLAHTQRKLGMLDESLANYKKALGLRPKFPEAREYLGEAYVQAALREAETLKGYGPDGKEELEELTKGIKETAEKL